MPHLEDDLEADNSPRILNKPKFDHGDENIARQLEEARSAIYNCHCAKDIGVVDRIYQIPGMYIDIPLLDGWSGLMYAACYGKPDLVSYFLDNKADPNFHCHLTTALHAICSFINIVPYFHLECTKLLVAGGANINFLDRYNASPLILAAKSGDYELVHFLIENKAEINHQDNRGMSPLSYAAFHGHAKIALELKDRNSDLTILSATGLSIPELCYTNDKTELGDVLNRAIKGNSNQEEIINLKKCNLVTSKKKKDYENLEIFLDCINLASLAPIFAHQHLTFDDLLHIENEELILIGVEDENERRQILTAVESTHKAKVGGSDVKRPPLKCNELGKIAENLVEHLNLTDSNVTFINRKIKTNPAILKYLKEHYTVKDMEKETDLILEECEKLKGSFQSLKETITKLEGFQEEKQQTYTVKENYFHKSAAYFGSLVLAAGVVGSCLYFKKPTKLFYKI